MWCVNCKAIAHQKLFFVLVREACKPHELQSERQVGQAVEVEWVYQLA
jgi:hypothetical protein